MDLNTAILYGQLVKAAYDVPANDLTNRAGQAVPAGLGPNKKTFQVISSVFANDLATDKNPARGKNRVSIGLLLQETVTGEAVIAIRGTEGIHEWVQDANFGDVKCPFLAGAGETEDGFTAMYESFSVADPHGSLSVTKSLATVFGSKPATSLTICGHSLGGALATLQALDAAANSAFKNPTVYTYASPRTGDPQFANVYDAALPNTFRIANRLDLVPQLPPPPMYEHVLGLNELTPLQIFPPKILVAPNPVCEHVLNSYLFLLSRLAKGEVLPLGQGCTFTGSIVWLGKQIWMEIRDIASLKKEFGNSSGSATPQPPKSTVGS